MTAAETKVFKTYMCLICGFIYDEAAGLPEEGILSCDQAIEQFC